MTTFTGSSCAAVNKTVLLITITANDVYNDTNDSCPLYNFLPVYRLNDTCRAEILVQNFLLSKMCFGARDLDVHQMNYSSCPL